MSSNQYLIGFLGLGRLLGAGIDFPVLGPQLEARVVQDPTDANALLDLSTLLFCTGNANFRKLAFDFQNRALQIRQIFHLPPPARGASLRLLVIMSPGDMTSNTPVDCLLEGADVQTTLLYMLPDRPFPSPLPEHDVIFVAIGISSENQKLLPQLKGLGQLSARPVVNAPDRINCLTRDRVSSLLQSVAGTVMPTTVLADRESLLRVQRQQTPLDQLLAGGRYPIIVRPVDSQGGKGLAKLDAATELAAYLNEWRDEEFFISNFIDYRSRDGQFKKIRVVLIGGLPFPCHMGISSHWMIHYVNAKMDESASKRNDEEQFFATFDRDFAVRHAQSLRAIDTLLGLDYLAIDCAETPDGELLVFEVDNAAIVHDLDDPAVYPYKRPMMQKVFAAFRRMLTLKAFGQST